MSQSKIQPVQKRSLDKVKEQQRKALKQEIIDRGQEWGRKAFLYRFGWKRYQRIDGDHRFLDLPEKGQWDLDKCFGSVHNRAGNIMIAKEPVLRAKPELVADQIKRYLKPFTSKIRTSHNSKEIHIVLVTEDPEAFQENLDRLLEQHVFSQQLNRMASEDPDVVSLKHIASGIPVTIHYAK